MRRQWFAVLGMVMAGGCASLSPAPDPVGTQQVVSTPFTEPRNSIQQTRASYTPASQDAQVRLDMIGRKLVGDNPQTGLRPDFIAISSADPEIFHVNLSHVYVTETLMKQCQNEGQIAALLAYELGRMVSEREAKVADQVRNPEPSQPIQLPIGGGMNSREVDPTNYIELARFEKQHPKQPRKLMLPNPQLVARSVLEHGGYQRNELDTVLPLLQNAERFTALQNQFKGSVQQSDWKQP